MGVSVLSPGSGSRVETGQPAGMFLLIAATSAGSVVLSCNSMEVALGAGRGLVAEHLVLRGIMDLMQRSRGCCALDT
jgi:hypothetical protein